MTYQDRYLAHQKRKAEQLTGTGEAPQPLPEYFRSMTEELLKFRRSQRLFNSKEISTEDLDAILKSATYAPNSCNRHGIRLRLVLDRTEKSLLGGLLVGGVGWVHRASAIILFMADREAYASPNEKEFMHYCDVGFKAMNMWLTAESRNIGACYINPNIMPTNRKIFEKRFGKDIFCGALAIGHYDQRVTESPHPTVDEIMV